MRTKRWLLIIGAVAASALAVPAGGAGSPSREQLCDGDFHLVKRFTRGSKTAVSDPAIEGDNLWLLQTFRNRTRDHRAFLRVLSGEKWGRVRVPLSGGRLHPTSLDTTSDGSVWVTMTDDRESGNATIFRWDGSGWHEEPASGLPSRSVLNDIDMWSPVEGWAVGSYEMTGARRALALRWNGETWAPVPTPMAEASELRSISMSASDEAWALAVGDIRSTIRWDGDAWTEHPLPERAGYVLQPYDIEARSPDEAWVTGAWERRSSASALLSWNESHWTIEDVRDRRGLDWLLAVDSGNDVWTVGEQRTRTKTTPIALGDGGEEWASIQADDPGRGGYLGDVTVEGEVAWATGRASSRRNGLFGVLQKACTDLARQ